MAPESKHPKRRRVRFLMLLCFVGIGVSVSLVFSRIPPRGTEAAGAVFARELLAVGDANFPPFTFLEDGDPKGFDVDLLRELAERKGLRVEIRLTDWTSAMDAVRSGAADILVGVSDSGDRRDYLGFTERMLSMKSHLFAANDTFAFARLEDLRGVAVGVEKGDVAAQFLRDRHPDIPLREFDTQRAAIEALAAGDIPVAALDYYSGLLSLQKLGLERRIKVIGDPILEAAYCLGVRKGDDALLIPLNDGLEALKSDGTVQRILDRWIGSNFVSDRYWRYAMYGLSALFAAGAALLSWNLSLRRAVRLRTRELSELAERFDLYLEHSPIYMFLKDEHLKTQMLSRNFEVLMGKPLAELRGRGASDYYPQEIAKKIDETDKAVLEGGAPIVSILEFSGRVFNTIRFPVPRRDRPPLLAGFYIDVTEERLSRDRLVRSLQEKETLIRELYHRTKNTLQVIGSMIDLQAQEHPDDRELQALVASTGNRINAIALVHQMLYRGRDLSRVPMREYLEELCSGLLAGNGEDLSRIGLVLDIPDRSVLLDVAVPLGLIVNELMANSIAHAFPGDRSGTIRVALSDGEPGRLLLSYSDDGVGLPVELDPRSGVSLGLKLVYSLCEQQLSGTVSTENSGGLRYMFDFKDDLYRERV